MPNTREKLIEFLGEVQSFGCKHTHEESASSMGFRENTEVADHLIANGVTVQQWISVKDRLPEDASTVLAIDSDGTICSAYYVGRWHGGGDLDEDAVTHWMPLPKPPNEVEQ